MKRFILLSFAFMALGFYELSGGADFDPVAAREAAVLARAEQSGTTSSPTTTLADTTSQTAAQPRRVDDAPEVTRTALNLLSVDKVLAAPDPVAPRETVELASALPDEEGSIPDQIAGTPLVLPSLAFAGTSLQASSDSVEVPRDIRSVAGAAVNMRAGPGTEHGVVAQLDRNTEVEILQDAGTGWVQLRALSGGQTGWVADFLLAAR